MTLKSSSKPSQCSGPDLPAGKPPGQSLRARAPYVPTDLVLPRFEALPAAERRRVGPVVKLSIWRSGCRRSRRPAERAMRWRPCSLLRRATATSSTRSARRSQAPTARSRRRASTIRCTTRRPATGASPPRSRAPSTSLCAFDWSFAAGLLEAATQASIDHESVLLISYDLPYPEPLRGVRPIRHPFASALLIARERSARSVAACELGSDSAGNPSRMQDGNLEQLRRDNPAARSFRCSRRSPAPAATEILIREYRRAVRFGVSVTPC